MRNAHKLVRVVGAVIALVAAGCNDSHTASAGSESHFLERCLNDASCGVLDCIANVCTRACTTDAVCDDVSGASACMEASSGAPTTCEVACGGDDDCGAGTGLTCRAGVCRPPRATASPMTTASSGQVDAGATSGSVTGGTGAVQPMIAAAGRGPDRALPDDAVGAATH